MLSYKHAFHAGNLADLQKHGLLAFALDYLTRKDKPVTYIETHAGRGLYDLGGEDALKTGEAEAGIQRHGNWFAASHPFSRVRQIIHEERGGSFYPGSPALAAHLLRDMDQLHFAELHPTEFIELQRVFHRRAKVVNRDGFAHAHALCPPTPRRGLMLIDPPYEVKADYEHIPTHMRKIARAWNVGVIMLWYPLLTSQAHKPMLAELEALFPDALRHEVRFPPARPGHGMVGSGMFVVNPPFGLEEEAKRLSRAFGGLK